MFETININGYDLRKLPNHPDLWEIDPKSSEVYFGSLKEVVVYMLNNLKFEMNCIEEGVNLLADNVNNFHNSVHFGAFRTPIFTFKKEEKYVKRAS